jgi:crotonobetainyl-CoA:carnitine CoA-transferase CaiB-like acyl-CoA transferase
MTRASKPTFATTYPGLRVLDLSTNIAGPLAAMVLGDQGADVIKVERPRTGDDTRALPPHRGTESTVFLAFNRNKRSIELDLKAPEGREALLRLAEDADVVIESFGPGVAAKLGLTFEDFRERNPGVVVCTVSAYGSGPIGRRLPGYDGLIQAFTGMMSFNGHPERPPARVAPSAVDISTGLWAVIAIQSALTRRGGVPKAQHVEVSLVDSAMMLMSHQVLGFLATGEAPVRLGAGTPAAVPFEAFEAADGSLMVAVANDRHWVGLCRALDTPDLLADESLATASGRVGARERIHRAVAHRLATDTVDAWLMRLEAAGVPAGPVLDLPQALEHPLMAERDLLVRPAEDPLAPELLRSPIDPAGAGVRRPPPQLGEHTAEVLAASSCQNKR